MHVGGIMGSQSSLLEFLPAWIFMILQKDRRGEMQELAAGCQTRTCSRQEDGRIPDLGWWTGERAIYKEYPLYWRTSGIQLAEELKVFSASWSSILWMVPFLLLSAQLWIFVFIWVSGLHEISIWRLLGSVYWWWWKKHSLAPGFVSFCYTVPRDKS